MLGSAFVCVWTKLYILELHIPLRKFEIVKNGYGLYKGIQIHKVTTLLLIGDLVEPHTYISDQLILWTE